ncbi:MAG: hypothetical protein PHR51_01600 [Patescibacteria group bacterium]|nr:hypothetical protein [Patescibacteria group bacterium]
MSMIEKAPDNLDNTEPVRGWRADSELRHDELYSQPESDVESDSRPGSTKSIEAKLGGRFSTQGIVEWGVTETIWAKNPRIREQAYELAKARYPMPGEQTGENVPRWLQIKYENAWRSTGKWLIRTAVFGAKIETDDSAEQNIREDMRRRELLAYNFLIPTETKRNWGKEERLIRRGEKQVRTAADKLSARAKVERDQLVKKVAAGEADVSILREYDKKKALEQQALVEKMERKRQRLLERREGLAQVQTEIIQGILNRPEYSSAESMMQTLLQQNGHWLEQLQDPHSARRRFRAIRQRFSFTETDWVHPEDQQAIAQVGGLSAEAQRRRVEIMGATRFVESRRQQLEQLQGIWKELDQKQPEDFLEPFREALLEGVSRQDFVDIWHDRLVQEIDDTTQKSFTTSLQERLGKAKASVEKQRQELLRLYDATDRFVEPESSATGDKKKKNKAA